MQRYQVFIDEHSLLVGEKRKSNQQFDSVIELFEPEKDELITLLNWLKEEKKITVVVFLYGKNEKQLWEVFKSAFKNIDAAGGLVKNYKDNYLFIYRLEKWDLPKGKMEKGETPKESALREVEEECGISELKITGELPATYHIYFHKERFVLKRTYWFKMEYSGDENLIPQEEENIESAVWVSPENIKEQLANTYASLKEIILTVRK